MEHLLNRNNNKLLFLTVGLFFMISCKTTQNLQVKNKDLVEEKSGILASINKESNWFIPLAKYDKSKDILENLDKENLQTGFYLDYSIDNELFKFINSIDAPVNNYRSKDGVEVVLIPITIRYKKLVTSDRSCEMDLRENSYLYFDKLLKFTVDNCLYLSINIRQNK